MRAAWKRSGPFDPLLAECLSKVYLETFRLGAAREVIDHWAAAVPHDAKPWLWRAEIDGRLDDPVPVLRDYREALRRDPTLIGPRRRYAEGLWADGQIDEAEHQFSVYLEQRPDDGEAWLGAARVALARGDRDEASRLLAKGIEINPELAPLWSERGNLHLARGDAESALADLKKAARLDRHDPETQRRLALALSRLGRDTDARNSLVESHRLLREKDQLKGLRDRLRRQPNDRDAQVAAARWLIEHDHADEGLRWAKKVLTEDPVNQAMHALLAEFYQAQGELGLANFHRLKLKEGR